MNWDRIALCITDLLGVCLIVRLLLMHLHRVYSSFCAFIFLQLVASSVAFWDMAQHPRPFDYRTIWLTFSPLIWGTKLWVVYSVLEAVLGKLPGILRWSRRLLHVVFPTAILIAALTAVSDVSRPESIVHVESAVNLAFVLDRVISTSALVVLVVILAFVLWFPVQLPKNLVNMSFALVLYFAIQNALLLARPVFAPIFGTALSAVDTVLLGVCFLFWLVTITPADEHAQVRLGHVWEPSQQKRLVEQLESMNAALLRQARRS